MLLFVCLVRLLALIARAEVTQQAWGPSVKAARTWGKTPSTSVQLKKCDSATLPFFDAILLRDESHEGPAAAATCKHGSARKRKKLRLAGLRHSNLCHAALEK